MINKNNYNEENLKNKEEEPQQKINNSENNKEETNTENSKKMDLNNELDKDNNENEEDSENNFDNKTISSNESFAKNEENIKNNINENNNDLNELNSNIKDNNNNLINNDNDKNEKIKNNFSDEENNEENEDEFNEKKINSKSSLNVPSKSHLPTNIFILDKNTDLELDYRLIKNDLIGAYYTFDINLIDKNTKKKLIKCSRRYDYFNTFYNKLIHKYPYILFPRLSPKKYKLNLVTDEELIEIRKDELKFLLIFLYSHEEYASLPECVKFINDSNFDENYFNNKIDNFNYEIIIKKSFSNYLTGFQNYFIKNNIENIDTSEIKNMYEFYNNLYKNYHLIKKEIFILNNNERKFKDNYYNIKDNILYLNDNDCLKLNIYQQITEDLKKNYKINIFDNVYKDFNHFDLIFRGVIELFERFFKFESNVNEIFQLYSKGNSGINDIEKIKRIGESKLIDFKNKIKHEISKFIDNYQNKFEILIKIFMNNINENNKNEIDILNKFDIFKK